MKMCRSCGEEKSPEHFCVRRGYGDGLQTQCKACNASYRSRNREKLRKQSLNWRAENPDKSRACAASYRKNNIDKVRSAKAAWVSRNAEKVKSALRAWHRANPEKHRANCLSWQKANPAKNRASVARHRAERLRATPAWANEFFISEAYDLAQLRTKTTGFNWHVDHIVPLRSKLVCGLHVENNLRVIPATHNIAKGNRHWPDMPEERLHGE